MSASIISLVCLLYVYECMSVMFMFVTMYNHINMFGNHLCSVHHLYYVHWCVSYLKSYVRFIAYVLKCVIYVMYVPYMGKCVTYVCVNASHLCQFFQ